METMTVGELKAKFSSVLERLKRGEEVVISYGKRREKVGVLIPYNRFHLQKKKRLGLLKGKATCIIHDDFKMSDQELLDS
ncbi:MAG: hypothetical protein PVG49_18255 [Desulfobacteraceae bacterium]|jgi:antitoxin (DNA-binding transcriptional repressor) of toxin-antitoxin stability system